MVVKLSSITQPLRCQHLIKLLCLVHQTLNYVSGYSIHTLILQCFLKHLTHHMWLSTQGCTHFLSIFLLLSTAAVRCLKGWEEDPSNAGVCRPCLKGSYKVDDKPEACTQCTAGNTTAQEESTSAEDCTISKHSLYSLCLCMHPFMRVYFSNYCIM